MFSSPQSWQPQERETFFHFPETAITMAQCEPSWPASQRNHTVCGNICNGRKTGFQLPSVNRPHLVVQCLWLLQILHDHYVNLWAAFESKREFTFGINGTQELTFVILDRFSRSEVWYVSIYLSFRFQTRQVTRIIQKIVHTTQQLVSRCALEPKLLRSKPQIFAYQGYQELPIILLNTTWITTT